MDLCAGEGMSSYSRKRLCLFFNCLPKRRLLLFVFVSKTNWLGLTTILSTSFVLKRKSSVSLPPLTQTVEISWSS